MTGNFIDNNLGGFLLALVLVLVGVTLWFTSTHRCVHYAPGTQTTCTNVGSQLICTTYPVEHCTEWEAR